MNMMMAFFIFLVLSTFPLLILSFGITPPQENITLTSFTKLQYPLDVSSTGAISFDLFGAGPYAGVSDGRILKYERLLNHFRDFAYTSPNRTKAKCDGKYSVNDPICGSPRGLGFNKLTWNLYCVDPYIGLGVVGPLGGLTTTLVPTNNGVPYLFLLALEVDDNGIVYFTDASMITSARNAGRDVPSGDNTGRVLKYDPKSKNVTILLSQLERPLGLATDNDASFLLVSEFTAKRIRRYWLKGEKAGTCEIFMTFQGSPNKIKRNQDGDFWVAVNNIKKDFSVDPQGVKISPSGQILATVDLGKDYKQNITIVEEQAGKLYVTGISITYIGQYNIKYVQKQPL